YTDDTALIPKNSSVIVRRIPIGGVKATSKTYVISRTEPVSGTSKAVCKNTISHFFLHTALNSKQCLKTLSLNVTSVILLLIDLNSFLDMSASHCEFELV
ncbi:PREDICTED: E3 ubiquitin-protein ligase RBBP6-like, partial [Pterocles gutturalis]|uniref:E3 ubiquitin-protein ligase RBBP6-like n=1 Tax=Pterocles gutturalis TaxID=240206 RepID=UPI000528D05B